MSNTSIRFSGWRQTQKQAASLILRGILSVGLTTAASAKINANLSWLASTNPTVAGYNIYYGTTSGQYSSVISVGSVTNTVIPDLTENTTYYFAAKSRNSAGVESDFSNETAFAGVTATPNLGLRLKTLPSSPTGDALHYSLGPDAPAGASINATNGTLYWTPGIAYASTTNYLTITVTDAAHPVHNLTEILMVTVSDYLDFHLGATVVSAGQPGALPLTVQSSGTVTNLEISFAWPANALINPTLILASSTVGGSLQRQGDRLLVQLQTAPGQALTGSAPAAQINFQTTPGQGSAIVMVSPTAAAAITANGSAYANVLAEPGEVVVVGTEPILRAQSDAAHGRTLTTYANPGNYELQSASSLSAPIHWQVLTSYLQTNVAQSVSVDSSEPVVFYRLHQLSLAVSETGAAAAR